MSQSTEKEKSKEISMDKGRELGESNYKTITPGI